MKKIITLCVLTIALLFLTGCPMQFNMQDEETGEQSAFLLPSDIVKDTARTAGGNFQFETLLPVQMDIKIDLYDPNADADENLLSEALVPVIVILEDRDGNNIYSGMSGNDGTFSSVINLPAAPENMVLKLIAAGFKERKINISNMVEYSSISRTVGMAKLPVDVLSTKNRSLTGIEDTDGDGVPDIYDADPNDPDITFVNTVPAQGQLTVAFEDLFGKAQAGDADYNDFIARYKITETSGTDGISEIYVSADAVAKMAGYNHRFGVRINSFEGVADLKGEYINAGGVKVRMSESGLAAPLEIDLFENTRYAVGRSAWFTLSFTEAQRRGADAAGKTLNEPPYNPYLHIKNTGHDVHLIGEEALTDSINPMDTFRDAEGFPWGLLVPTEWIHPEESQRIETSYPRFTLWRESGGEKHADWYLYKDDPYEPSENNAPYDVTGPSEYSYEYDYDTPYTFSLSTNAPGYDLDPDGDSTEFKVDDLPTGVTLDAITGEVTILMTVPFFEAYDEVMSVWLEDEHGLDSQHFTVTIHFNPKS